MAHLGGKDEENFNGEVEFRPKPKPKTGQQILKTVNVLPPIILGKAQGGKKIEGVWKRKYVFHDQ